MTGAIPTNCVGKVVHRKRVDDLTEGTPGFSDCASLSQYLQGSLPQRYGRAICTKHAPQSIFI